MNIAKKILYSTLLLAGVAFIPNAQAETETVSSKPRSVLFKIHEVKPVIDAQGLITDCDFIVTVYNRTDDSLQPSKIEMGWTDNISATYFSDENKISSQDANGKKMRSKEQNVASLGDVTTVVDIPALGSYKQASVKASVKTEKCFILIDNLKFNVSACGFVGKDEDANLRRRNRNNNSASQECVNLFEYIDSANPEYYSEFKNISFSEQEKQMADDAKQDISDLEKQYNKVIKSFEKVEKIIGNIQ